MADSVDRVFVHALNTVKKIPKTGASRPPPSDRLRLYGLYKQAMEGDVDGVMEQPTAGPFITDEELRRERDKWDAWNVQKGLSRTEAKRRYVEALVETMYRYANTTDAIELVTELEFVWNQIKHNTPSSTASSPKATASSNKARRQLQQPPVVSEGPMKILSPMSEQDEADARSQKLMDLDDALEEKSRDYKAPTWQKKIERAVTKLSAEVAALREQIATGREWRSRRDRSFSTWFRWLLWVMLKHLLVNCVLLAVVLLWMRKRKDGRLEELVRSALKIMREYVRKVLPTR
ncbi:Autophagy protein 37 [Claviceps purpurea]|nr:Autophagy protein 37 [Claviceps purpurea]KAG6159651.1 Autophagy protein 37 [Claviceps purpurea]KAG6167254.1 Autophagy protein 37 [Claviceps purpurea]KAG6174190.1 Autophagy protein 37 [Claviceps purpurea]KAG6188652.1 Autophagy protein 37 [Claviceps purpurea]